MPETSDIPNSDENQARRSQPVWKSKSLLVAAAMAAVGLVLWLRSPPSPSSTRSAPGMSSLADSSSNAQPATARARSPALFRFGVSYIGGFFLGWAFRRSIKLALLVGGACVVGIGVMKKTGLLDLDWAVMENQVRQSLAWVRGEAGNWKALLAGYLPSTLAGAIGMLVGAFRK